METGIYIGTGSTNNVETVVHSNTGAGLARTSAGTSCAKGDKNP